jgi:RNA polymerase sigma-70 factor (ECF subfamily)
MLSTSGDSVDLLAGGQEHRPVTEPFGSDAHLAAAARAGDRTAFGRLYERYARMVHGVLLAKVPRGEVDDLVQDVFIKALRRLSALREAASFPAWLAAIARNLANDYHRRSSPVQQFTDGAPDDAMKRGSASPQPDIPASAIWDALTSLPDAYKETLILRLVEGMTGPEIAARTGMTHGSVRVNLYRGMEQLRAKLNARLPVKFSARPSVTREFP